MLSHSTTLPVLFVGQVVAEPFRARTMLQVLVEHGVDFVVIGGIAGIARGSAYMTQDLDIAYSRDPENLRRLAGALTQLGARLRGAPEDVPFLLDEESLRQGAHFTFETASGPLDILDRPDGSPPYAELKRRSGEPLDVDGLPVLVASLDDLIAMKEATGRPRDVVVASELRMLADEVMERDGS
jgi:hypothetical protein